ncbi:MAG: thiolase family protein [Cryobacterium sp.]|nr:thiolase family protein [Cryobacterium sp.]
MNVQDAVIVDLVRTPSGKGKPGGALSSIHPVDLLAEVLESIVSRNNLEPGMVDDVIAGCVSQIGEQAYNIGRNALLAAGFPDSVPGTTVDRQCGSSQQAAMFAAQAVMTGQYDVVIACGVESMSRIPLGTSGAGMDRFGSKLRARYPEGLVNQGVSAELIANKWGLSREVLDEFAARSHRLSVEARDRFSTEILPIAGVSVDETVRDTTTVEGLASLAPAFRTDELATRFPELDWKITPGNSSPLTDGASAALIMSAKRATQLGLKPRARFHAFAVTGSDPIFMLTGIIPATKKVLERAGLSLEDIDWFEVNEAFASVPLAWQKELGTDPQKLNPRGGAIALGHALGSSGTRLLTTLVNQLEATGKRWGLQTMCEGGGMANATIIERL